MEDYTNLCEEINELAERVPKKAEDFAQSCCDKSISIYSSIENKNGLCSDAQYDALVNMRDGLRKWAN